MRISPFRDKTMICNRLGYVKCSNMRATFVTKLIPQLICTYMNGCVCLYIREGEREISVHDILLFDGG